MRLPRSREKTKREKGEGEGVLREDADCGVHERKLIFETAIKKRQLKQRQAKSHWGMD